MEFYHHDGIVIVVADIKPILYLKKESYHSGYHEINFIELFKNDEYFKCDPLQGTDFIADSSVKKDSGSLYCKIPLRY